MASQNWHTYLVNCPNNKTGNKDTSVYSSVLLQATTNNDKLVLLTNDRSTAVLAMDTNNKIVILHSLKNFGGMILEPTNRFAGLIGNGRVAAAMVINNSSLLAHVNIAMLLYSTIVACLDKAEIKGLAHPVANAARNLHDITSFLPAPWLLEAIVGANTNDPSLIILMASEFAAEFNNKHKNDVEYITGTED